MLLIYGAARAARLYVFEVPQLLLCLNRYVLLLLGLKCCNICLLTTCSCKVSCWTVSFVILFLSCVPLQFFFQHMMHCIYRSTSDTKSSFPKAPSMESSWHIQWHISTDYSKHLQQSMYLYHYRENPGANSSR